MDCPSEENLVRLKLDGIVSIKNLDFDVPERQLTVYHDGRLQEIEDAIRSLDLGGERIGTESAEDFDFKEQKSQKHLLWIVLAINFGFFVLEMTTGLISGSMGLVADSLDMLADSSVYAISLFAVGKAIERKKSVARIAGYLQMTLAAIGFIEVVRRFLGVEEMPDFRTMIVVSILALTANGICLYLLQRSRSDDAHMKASTIFTSNDVIINLGVIVAGILVMFLNSNKPDLIIGTIVFVVVVRGAIKILKIGK